VNEGSEISNAAKNLRHEFATVGGGPDCLAAEPGELIVA
jgi:hypothetical protein